MMKRKEGVGKRSGMLFMIKEDKEYILGDCGMKGVLEGQELGEIAVESGK